MKILVRVISPILVDGVWKKAGEEIELDHDRAHAEESVGMVDIVSVDGVPVVWGSCCNPV